MYSCALYHRHAFSDFFFLGAAVHRISETDNPSSNCLSKLRDRVRRIVHSKLKHSSFLLTLRRTRKFIPPLPPPWYKEGGGGVGWNPSPKFLICCSILKRFCFQWKAFDRLNKVRYILWVVALLEACDVNNGRHLGRDLGFYQELEIRLKP